MLEAQITQISSSSTPLGRLPGKHEPNPREYCNAMILRGGKQLEGPKWGSNYESLHDLHDAHGEHVENDKKEVSTPSNNVILMCIILKGFIRTLKSLPQNLILHLCHSLKGWLRLWKVFRGP